MARALGAFSLTAVGGPVWLLCGHILKYLWRRQPARPLFEFGRRAEFESKALEKLTAAEQIRAIAPAYEYLGGKKPTRCPTLLAVSGSGFHSLDLLDGPHPGTIGSHLVVRLSDITKVVSEDVRIRNVQGILKDLERAVGPHPRTVSRGEWVACRKFTITLASGESHTFWSPYKALDDVLSEINDRRANGAILDQTIGGTQALDRLRTLLEEGLIEQSEFDRAKAGFLGAPAERQQTTEARIRQLHSLMTDGILTASEFRQKKWDLLSRDNST